MKNFEMKKLKFSSQSLNSNTALKSFGTQKVLNIINYFLKSFDAHKALEIYLTINLKEENKFGQKNF
jgi:hypothetical protein